MKMSQAEEEVADSGYVKLTVAVPKPLHEFMNKIANLEGQKAEDWYSYWIRGDFEAFLDDFKGLGLDMKKVLECNDLTKTLDDLNHSFVERILHDDK
jgi:hypothetical protein